MNSGWNFWVLNRWGGDDAPKKWGAILLELQKILDNKNINKIEAASFSIRRYRTVRWKLPPQHIEYSTKEDSLNAAKKLTKLLLNSDFGFVINIRLRKLLGISKKEFIICPLCNEPLFFYQFYKDGRKDHDSIQMGHKIPLTRGENTHNGKNVFWAHRDCNFIQGNKTINELFKKMAEILRVNGFRVYKK